MIFVPNKQLSVSTILNPLRPTGGLTDRKHVFVCWQYCGGGKLGIALSNSCTPSPPVDPSSRDLEQYW